MSEAPKPCPFDCGGNTRWQGAQGPQPDPSGMIEHFSGKFDCPAQGGHHITDWKHPESFWIGKKVRADRAIQTNGGNVMGKGAVGVISRKFGGFSVHVAECKHCHQSFYVRNASPDALTLVDA